MHQIQKLEIIGFKSFCDRTQIAFDEGITAVVGPNGCGKSNIADAISWVVGEQSAKSLRTDRMEGVIFNGTQARKATSMAEVVLTLKLSDEFSLPEGLDLSLEGFTVGRRLYRSGESEYYLDGRRCRLRDIQQLFEGTGLGPNSYALIEQGRIGQILSSKPADRRSLIEEAARITLFKSRRHSAEGKLELAQQNLLRIQDILRELVRQLSSLKRQAAKARRYQRLRDELRGVHKLKLVMEHRDVLLKLELCHARFREAQEQEQSIVQELSRADEARGRAQESCRQREEIVNQGRDRLAGLKVESERAANSGHHQESQKTDLEGRLLDLARERNSVEERRQLIEREQGRLEQLVSRLQEESRREQQVLAAEQARSEEIARALSETEANIEQTRAFLLSGAGQLADLRNLKARCQEGLQRIEAQTGRLELERQNNSQERTALLLQLEGARQRDVSGSSRREEISSLHGASERQAAELEGRLERAMAETMALQEEYSLLQHRYSSLEEVEQRRTNYSDGVQKFLATSVPGERPVQTLADHVETDPRYEAAVEDYLNDPLQYILVDGLEDAVESVERVKRIGAGRCTFMTIKNGHTNGYAFHRPSLDEEGIIGYLDDLLMMREDVRHAFERALPEFASTVMVRDLDTAFRVAASNRQTSFLTLSGEAYSPRGTLSAVGERKSMAGFLAIKREKRELELKLESARAKIQVARDELAALKDNQASLLDLLKVLGAESRRLELDSVGLHHEIARLEGEVRKLEQVENVASLELLQFQLEKQEFEARLAEALAGIEEIEERGRTGDEVLRALGASQESLRAENDSLLKSLAGLFSARAVLEERSASAESELRRLAGEADEVRKRTEANRVETEGTAARIHSLEIAQQETRAQIERLNQWVREAEEALANGQRAMAGERESLAGLEETIRRLYSEREAAAENRGRIEIEETRLDSDLGHLERACLDEFHTPLVEAGAEILQDDLQRDYEEICLLYEQLRERVENFGAINMRALEEYQELDERYQFMNRQRADIEQSIADTQKAIAEINRRSIEQFQDAYSKIRENFIEVFQSLFKGGQCDLRLLDEGDVLESGIDIIAQPPGKRLQNVLLLSGGEKALTALALLIAIFRYRPSPFCVLDEVDAPLDDANITRFTQLISELSTETQFVIITHNKRTMEIAQALYGVTMEEPGVSKIVSVDFRTRNEALAR
jgi:chromosome segregation protein